MSSEWIKVRNGAASARILTAGELRQKIAASESYLLPKRAPGNPFDYPENEIADRSGRILFLDRRLIGGAEQRPACGE